MNWKLSIAIWLGVSGYLGTLPSCSPNSSSPDRVYEQKADSILKLMTLEEKIGQLSLFTSDWDVTGPVINNNYKQLIKEGKAGAIFNAFSVDYVRSLQKVAVEESRLKIPLLFGYDVIHGHKTIFPIPLAQSCTWDMESIEKSERIAASEATAEGINWTFSPMVDISRDPRWGRVMEGSGEDVWLGSSIAAARVKGFQGDNLADPNTLLACVKHFAAYGAPEAGRDYNTVDMSQQSLFENYLPPYKAAIDAGVGSVMTSFNEIAGTPSTSNPWLLNELLRKKWGFKGLVVTDYTSINELIPHGVATDSAEAGMLAINAGVDMDMQGNIYNRHLIQLVKQQKVSKETIDNAVMRILVAKFKLGLFADPYRYCSNQREKTEVLTIENIAFARKFASKSCVLLKNQNQLLPLPITLNSVAVIGPLADAKQDMLGSWSAAGDGKRCISLLEGLKNTLNSETKIAYEIGCAVNDQSTAGFAKAVAAARGAQVVILALGETRDMSGEAASRSTISLPGVQQQLAEAIIKANPKTVVVLFNGRPLAIPELDSIAPAILETWFGGTEAGNGVADVLLGKYNPSGKLTMTFPRNVGQIPIYYNHKNTGRPIDPSKVEKYKSKYLDIANTPLYPFGYGLSYTTFDYSNAVLDKYEYTAEDTIVVRISVMNSGKFDGEEVVQLYVHDLVGEVTRPVKELKGFSKVLIPAGGSTTVTFKLTANDLRYYHSNMDYKFDPGQFEILVGTNSDQTKKVNFSIK
ncbi:glycoside hydrolase family 3 N-terminal domain-containing protein [Williamwhitmania taraxaci]|uniref:Periplasmic beta-glucosidase n=1 Tax=Williamwhitmania taraxaci TaxID=1640674 RepID=A0A1G6MVF2_9BACT|nr:glycoside hydrolase family 3 N-terminal domain-containing protein [Williamwhitmania taraxaci]SDC58945.1 beta-glucosidase [Williamwhitmania taraxaci]